MDDLTQHCAEIWRQRLRRCMEERGLTQLSFVGQLNKRYLTRYHQKDVSRWLNTGNQTISGRIGFPKYETMLMIADFFGVHVGYLTGETDEQTFTMSQACEYTGLDCASIQAIQQWNDGMNDIDSSNDEIIPHLRYHAQTLNRFLSSPRFSELCAKMLTLYEMTTIGKESPEKFNNLISSLAADSEFSNDFTLELIAGAFYGMASESFSSLLREAYPTPTRDSR